MEYVEIDVEFNMKFYSSHQDRVVQSKGMKGIENAKGCSGMARQCGMGLRVEGHCKAARMVIASLKKMLKFHLLSTTGTPIGLIFKAGDQQSRPIGEASPHKIRPAWPEQ